MPFANAQRAWSSAKSFAEWCIRIYQDRGTYTQPILHEYGIYEAQQAKYQRWLYDFFFYPLWVLPYCFLLATWASIILCKGYSTRQMMKSCNIEALCWEPPSIPYQEHQWWLRLWHQPAEGLGALPISIESIMVSHLVFSASEREIRDQISELENIPVANPLLVNSLVLAADLLRDLYTPSTDFFTTFCIEKDQMNHAYRQLVQRYAMAMTSNRHEINVYKILLFPSIYVLRFLNSYTRVWWFFQPLPWSSQIEAEASYRIKEFVQQSSVQIDAIIATHRRLDVRLDIQVVQAAIIQAASIQSRFEDEIADYSFWQRQFQAPRHLEYLTKNLALVERILNHLKKVKQFIQTVKAHSLDLIGQVQILYQNLNSDHISTLGSTSLGLILDKSFDDLASLYHTENMAYIHTIKQSCENDKIFPREQYPICLIDSLRVILSRIDNDDLGIHQRSWCIEQRNAMERYQPRNHTTLLAQILLQEVINEYYKQGLAVPTGSSPQPTIQI